MSMIRVIKSLVLMIFLITLISLAINVQSIYQQHRLIKKVAKTMVTYAQKNGGFVDAVNMNGDVIRNPEDFMIDLIHESGLDYNIPYNLDHRTVEFVPGLYIQVNKKDMFEIIIKEPKLKVVIPFVGEMEWVLEDIHDYGYSHKYFK